VVPRTPPGNLPECAATDLTGYDGLLIPDERLHRGQLTRVADRILELLDAGGTVIAFGGGEPVPEPLPGVRWQPRPAAWRGRLLAQCASWPRRADGPGEVPALTCVER